MKTEKYLKKHHKHLKRMVFWDKMGRRLYNFCDGKFKKHLARCLELSAKE